LVVLFDDAVTDPGRFGPTVEGRPAFTQMMDEWVNQRHDFDYVLRLDVNNRVVAQTLPLSAVGLNAGMYEGTVKIVGANSETITQYLAEFGCLRLNAAQMYIFWVV
jgi:hypothetical protein